jgi:glycosyltransferase involved in cell wall biosynthesis
MKIAVVAPTSLPSRRANTIQVMKMSQAFVRLGHAIWLFAPTEKPARVSHRWDELARHYGLMNEFPVIWLRANRFFRGYDYGLRAVHLAQEMNVDLLYTRHPQTAALSSTLGVPTILEIHDIPQGWIGPWLFRRFIKGNGARRLVVITHALARDLMRKFSSLPRISTVYNSELHQEQPPQFILVAPDGVDLDRYSNFLSPSSARMALVSDPNSPAKHLDIDAFTAGYTGHLYAGRGADLLMVLASRLPDITFLLIGGEPNSVASIRAQVAEKGLRNIVLTGFISNAELPLYQAACDVLLMPYQDRVAGSSGGDISRYLSPMKVFEYLACGRPIIASSLPVFNEILNSKNAIFVPFDDLDTWVKEIKILQNDPERRKALSTQARRDAERYDWTSRSELILKGLTL